MHVKYFSAVRMNSSADAGMFQIAYHPISKLMLYPGLHLLPHSVNTSTKYPKTWLTPFLIQIAISTGSLFAGWWDVSPCLNPLGYDWFWLKDDEKNRKTLPIDFSVVFYDDRSCGIHRVLEQGYLRNSFMGGHHTARVWNGEFHYDNSYSTPTVFAFWFSKLTGLF